MRAFDDLGLSVLERGWLSSNNILLHPAPGDAGALLVDSGHLNHAEQTVALVQHALARIGQPRLSGLINTHLHSDHCGGNAAVTAAFQAPIAIPPGQAAAVRCWDEQQLSYRASGQRMQPFGIDTTLEPGQPLVVGARAWQVLAAPGHDPHSVMLFEPGLGVLISADALWQNGFGVIFPEVTGEPGFDDAAAVLDQIAALPVRLVIPGHGAPFTDVADALSRARSRLAAFRANPLKHQRHAAKVFLKYHVMEEQALPLHHLRRWAGQTPLMQASWQALGPTGPEGRPAAIEDWIDTLLHELAQGGALRIEGGQVLDR